MNPEQLNSIADNILEELDKNNLNGGETLIVMCTVLEIMDEAYVKHNNKLSRGDFIDTIFKLLKDNLKDKR